MKTTKVRLEKKKVVKREGGGGGGVLGREVGRKEQGWGNQWRFV